MTFNRRQFIGSSAIGSALGLSFTLIPSRAFGANERLRGAVFGLGGQGNYHLESYSKAEGVEIVGVADPDLSRAQSAQKKLLDKFGVEAIAVQDPRKLIEDQSIDFVSVVTCNHWHSLLGIWSAQAGKHVYVEKPCSQNLFEGHKLAEAADKYGVCIQHGTQRRHDGGIKRSAVAWATGKYGKPIALMAYANRPRNGLGFKPVTTPPANLDWNTWVGPAQMVPFHGNYAPYNWHWFWNFGNGEIGNNGVHYFDCCRIALGQLKPGIKHPQNVIHFGTRIVDDAANGYKDQAETPTVQLGIYDFDGIPLIFQSCNLRNRDNNKWSPRETAQFVTEDGYFEGGRFHTKDGKSESVEVDCINPNPGGQFGNFLNCVRDNTPEKLNAPIQEGHFSAAVCHLGNVSYRLAKPAPLAECKNALGTNPIMQEIVEQTLDNVQQCLPNLNLDKDIVWNLGQSVSINNQTLKVDGNEAATALLTRPEREPFVVPEKV